MTRLPAEPFHWFCRRLVGDATSPSRRTAIRLCPSYGGLAGRSPPQHLAMARTRMDGIQRCQNRAAGLWWRCPRGFPRPIRGGPPLRAGVARPLAICAPPLHNEFRCFGSVVFCDSRCGCSHSPVRPNVRVSVSMMATVPSGADNNYRGFCRRGGRVVYRGGLENRWAARSRGFESLPLRHFSPLRRESPKLGCPVDVAT